MRPQYLLFAIANLCPRLAPSCLPTGFMRMAAEVVSARERASLHIRVNGVQALLKRLGYSMNRPLIISIVLGGALLAGLSVYGCFGITQHLIAGIDRISDSSCGGSRGCSDSSRSEKRVS